MDLDRTIQNLIEAYSNPTKMKIIFLLSDNNEMTVTEMASHTEVGRSNLYHFVKEMVRDGILSPPKIRPKLNYVEKYYKLNQGMLDSSSLEKLEKSFASLSTDQARRMLSSFLMGASAYLLVLTKKINEADDETIKKLGDAFFKRKTILQYSSTHVGSAPKGEEYLKKAAEEFSKSEDNDKEKESLKVMILSLPFL